MNLVCDEDVGTGVPNALRLVGYTAKSLRGLGLGGKPDTLWLALAGKRKWLAFSSNKKILTVPVERQAIIDSKVGIIFLTTGIERTPNVLRLLLVKWNTLEILWETTEKPFVRFLTPNGHLTSKYKNLSLQA